MNSDNILTEIDLGRIFKYLFSSKFRKLTKHTKNREVRKALSDFNKANDELAKAVKDAFGKELKNTSHLSPDDLIS